MSGGGGKDSKVFWKAEEWINPMSDASHTASTYPMEKFLVHL